MNSLIFLAVGLLFLGLGCFVLYDNTKKIFQWVKTKAQVTDHLWEKKSYGDSNQVAFEQLQFVTSNGREIISKSMAAVATPNKIGKSVTIYYNPEKPEELIVLSIFRLLGPAVLLISFGLIFLLVV